MHLEIINIIFFSFHVHPHKKNNKKFYFSRAHVRLHVHLCTNVLSSVQKKTKEQFENEKHMQARQNTYYSCKNRQTHVHISNGPDKLKINLVEMKEITSLMH